MFIAPTYSFSRPANTTAYASADLVANSTTAGDVVPMRFGTEMLGGTGRVVAVRFASNNDAVTNANFNVHLFSASPTVTNGDNGALVVGTALTFIGTVACDLTSGAFVVTGHSKAKRFAITGGFGFHAPAASVALYGLIEAAAAYTPASGETIQVTLEIEG